MELPPRRTPLPIAVLAVGAALVASAPAPALAKKRDLGIDVSRFQGAIEWDRVADEAVGFAFVQASRGSGDDCATRPKRCGADAYYAANYTGAQQNGVRVGAYHRAFVGGETSAQVIADAQAEADLFIAQVGELRPGDLLPALDVEVPFAGLAAGDLRTWVRTWLGRVHAALGAKPIVYTNVSSWQATGNTTEFAHAGHRLWVASWGVSAPAVPAANWAGQGWSIWQYSNRGRIDGIDGRVDLNRSSVGLGKIDVP